MTRHIRTSYESYLYELDRLYAYLSNTDWIYAEREYQRCQDEGKIE